jgi:hypothetical protein
MRHRAYQEVIPSLLPSQSVTLPPRPCYPPSPPRCTRESTVLLLHNRYCNAATAARTACHISYNIGFRV